MEKKNTDYIEVEHEIRDHISNEQGAFVEFKINRLTEDRSSTNEEHSSSDESNSNSSKYLIVIKDISVEKRLKHEKEMKKYLHIMYASVSHELRTPINAIINCIHCLFGSCTQEQRYWLDIARSSSEFLLSLVNDTLDFTQMRFGKFSLNIAPCNI